MHLAKKLEPLALINFPLCCHHHAVRFGSAVEACILAFGRRLARVVGRKAEKRLGVGGAGIERSA
jgi:hypothetical protein